MMSVYFVVPGSLSTRTGGYIYDRRIIEGLRALGGTVTLISLPGTYPFLDEADIAKAHDAFVAIPNGAAVVVDGLAFGALPHIAEQHAGRLQLVALVHHPLADETGLSSQVAARLFASEERALRSARRVIVTSEYTARRLDTFAVSPDAIAVCVPGVDPAPLARGSGSDHVVLLCPASLTPRKGHAILFAALADLHDLDWRLLCAGNTGLDPMHRDKLAALRLELGLAERIEMCGEADEAELASLYDGADLLVLASHYEGYGMVISEALARGLPMVTTTGGALSDTVPSSAALRVPPGDAAAFREALRSAISDPNLRGQLAVGARAARAGLLDWNESARGFARALFGSLT